jgi:hypothetical protein
MTFYLRTRRDGGVTYFRVIEPTGRYRRVAGQWFRDCVVEFPDGRREVAGVREDVAA